jgi:hypothetical protein
MGIVEIHTWNSTADDIERPNRIMWDLDPGPAAAGCMWWFRSSPNEPSPNVSTSRVP